VDGCARRMKGICEAHTTIVISGESCEEGVVRFTHVLRRETLYSRF
jgi:hypothetical protein